MVSGGMKKPLSGAPRKLVDVPGELAVGRALTRDWARSCVKREAAEARESRRPLGAFMAGRDLLFAVGFLTLASSAASSEKFMTADLTEEPRSPWELWARTFE